MLSPNEEALSTWFDLERFKQELAQRKLRWGRPTHLLTSTTSTNDLALEGLHSGKPTGSLWIARTQTAGRGRRGRTWVSPPGDALLLTVLLRTPPSATGLSGLPLASGLAIRKVVEDALTAETSSNLAVSVKWPNDVYVGERKVAGVLIESRKTEEEGLGVAIGIGMNVRTETFPAEVPDATSLRLEGVPSDQLGLETLTAQLIAALSQRISLLLTQGASSIIEELRAHDLLLGRQITVDGRAGVARGFNAQGQLILEDDSRKLHTFVSGSVQQRGATLAQEDVDSES